jgi:hypothetical protein
MKRNFFRRSNQGSSTVPGADSQEANSTSFLPRPSYQRAKTAPSPNTLGHVAEKDRKRLDQDPVPKIAREIMARKVPTRRQDRLGQRRHLPEVISEEVALRPRVSQAQTRARSRTLSQRYVSLLGRESTMRRRNGSINRRIISDLAMWRAPPRKRPWRRPAPFLEPRASDAFPRAMAPSASSLPAPGDRHKKTVFGQREYCIASLHHGVQSGTGPSGGGGNILGRPAGSPASNPGAWITDKARSTGEAGASAGPDQQIQLSPLT